MMDTRSVNLLGGYHAAVDSFRRWYIADALRHRQGNVSHAARDLKLARTYLSRLIRELGLSPELARVRPRDRGAYYYANRAKKLDRGTL